jgi:hypothetical protein
MQPVIQSFLLSGRLLLSHNEKQGLEKMAV